MQELQNEITRLKEEHNRLTQARTRLQQVATSAAEKVQVMEKQLPELMVLVAMEETTPEDLAAFTQELQLLRAISLQPYPAATKILEDRMKSVLSELSRINSKIATIENRARYQTARDAITAKGIYTPFELEDLQGLASTAGELRDYTRFVQQIEEYRSRREQRRPGEDFPAFEYVPEK